MHISFPTNNINGSYREEYVQIIFIHFIFYLAPMPFNRIILPQYICIIVKLGLLFPSTPSSLFDNFFSIFIGRVRFIGNSATQ